MRILLFTFSFFCLLQSKALPPAGNYTIKGELKGLADGTPVYLTKKNAKGKMDTISMDKAKDGHFSLQGSLSQDGFFAFIWVGEIPKKYLALLLEQATFTLQGTKDSWPDVQVSGGASDKGFRSFIEQTAGLKKEMGKGNDKAIADSIHQLRLAFIEGHPDCSYTAYLIKTTRSFDTDKKQQEFNKLSTVVKESELGMELKSELDILAKSKPLKEGKLPVFDYATPTGKKLASYRDVISKNKLTLIDFWASWCVPCRKKNPEMVKLYNDFKDKGFTILGISLDNNLEAWKKAIDKDGLAWPQVIDPKGMWESESFTLFDISKNIPQTILVDGQGKIIGKNLTMAQLYEQITEATGK